MKLLPRHAVSEGNNFMINGSLSGPARVGRQGWVRRRLPVSMRVAATSIDAAARAHMTG